MSQDQLASWRDGVAKSAIIDFVSRVTDPDGPDYLQPSDRLATFDSDGTLMVEYPRTLEELFALKRIKAKTPTTPRHLPFPVPKSLQGFGHLVAGWAFVGDTPEEYHDKAEEFLNGFSHPLLKRGIDALAYQPMLELLRYLEDSGFTTAVVSASGMSFVRAFCRRVYGIGVGQVVGTTVAYYVRTRNGRVRAERGRFLIGGVTTRGRKASHVHQRFGRLPVFHAGNSAGDVEMFSIATGSGRPGFALLVRHDDAEREFAYTGDGADSRDISLAAESCDWTVASIRDDWKTVFGE